jgi:hypothetical protein
MAYVKVARREGKSIGRAVEYAGNEKKAALRSGLNVSDDPRLATLEMENTKEMYGQTEGRQYKHFIQSFKPDEVTPKKAHEIGRELAAKCFKGYEVYVGTHVDQEHIHNHFIVNSVNFENGRKYHKSSHFLDSLRQNSDQICERENLSIIQPRTPEMKQGEFQTANMNKYQLMQRVAKGGARSYVLDTARAVEKARQQSGNRGEFIAAMQRQGYAIKWQDNIRHVTFEDRDGNKVRLSNLEKTFNDNRFTKEGLEHEFETVRGRSRADGENGGRKTPRLEQPKPVRVREQSPEGAPDRVRAAVSGVKEGAGRYSFSANRERERAERELREKAARIEREKRERAEQFEKQRAAAKEQQRAVEPEHRPEHGERGFDIER